MRFSINTVQFLATHTLYILLSIKHSFLKLDLLLSYLSITCYKIFIYPPLEVHMVLFLIVWNYSHDSEEWNHFLLKVEFGSNWETSGWMPKVLRSHHRESGGNHHKGPLNSWTWQHHQASQAEARSSQRHIRFKKTSFSQKPITLLPGFFPLYKFSRGLQAHGFPHRSNFIAKLKPPKKASGLLTKALLQRKKHFPPFFAS